MGQASEIQKLIDATLAAYGRIDILVNNAATNPSFGPVVDTPESSGSVQKSVYEFTS